MTAVPATPPATGPVALLIGTRKGAFLLRGDRSRQTWQTCDPFFFGSIIHHFVLDPRDGRTMLVAARTGHLGPTVFRSPDGGATWQEAEVPPAFPKAAKGEQGRVVDHVFWLTPGHPSEPGVWYAGTSPQGLFRSEDGGRTWQGVSGYNDHPMREVWMGPDGNSTPDGPKLHSILVDPRDTAHLYIGLSGGGVFESRDRGATWSALNRGLEMDFLPGPPQEFGHDPHCVVLHPQRPDRLYQQNHCGVYRMDRPSDEWVRIGRNIPREVGDIGFPIALHPRDPDTVWVFPMDGTDVWPRTSPQGRPAAYVTRDAGATWQRQDRGLPTEHAYFTVKRQCMATDSCDPAGVYFGTTSGEVWGSADEGATWRCLAAHLPHIYSVEAVERTE